MKKCEKCYWYYKPILHRCVSCKRLNRRVSNNNLIDLFSAGKAHERKDK